MPQSAAKDAADSPQTGSTIICNCCAKAACLPACVLAGEVTSKPPLINPVAEVAEVSKRLTSNQSAPAERTSVSCCATQAAARTAAAAAASQMAPKPTLAEVLRKRGSRVSGWVGPLVVCALVVLPCPRGCSGAAFLPVLHRPMACPRPSHAEFWSDSCVTKREKSPPAPSFICLLCQVVQYALSVPLAVSAGWCL